ncbi:MAG: DUF4031 domain-containing protein [Psychrobacter sp.]|jgi:hypothetical protein|uniref:DUF4031 domain-containing protein n=1 Tax=Psychrobacter namhaensis TaxID=292734 RepID=A0ABW8L9D5_9GAMM|nr:DUF4031 domain-containing protein [Psychrobacter sp.]
MAIYVDFVRIEFRGFKWCHMLADTLQELHDFAAWIDVDKRLFHRNASYPHYDITVQMREIAIAHGAIPADRKKIIECAKKLKVELMGQTGLSELSGGSYSARHR